MEKAYHIYPANDLEEHTLHCEFPEGAAPFCPCKCQPEWREEDGAIYIVHNSYDGREGVEWANDLLQHTKAFEA